MTIQNIHKLIFGVVVSVFCIAMTISAVTAQSTDEDVEGERHDTDIAITATASIVTAQENSTSTPPTLGDSGGQGGRESAQEPPSTPGRPSVAGVGHNSVTLNWGAVSGATHYDAWYRNRDAGGVGVPGSWSQVDDIQGTTRTFTGLSPSTRYEFEVRAGNASGDSAWSPNRYGTTTAAPLPLALPDPSNLALTRGEEASFTLPSASGGSPPYMYSVSGLPSGLSFSASSRGVSGTPSAAGVSTVTYSVTDSASPAATRTQTFTVTITGSPAPSRPAMPSVTEVDHNSITLSWSAVSGATHYDVRYRDRDAGGPDVPGSWSQVDGIRGTSRTFTGLSPSTRYVFEVRAGNAVGDSAWSPERYGTTTAAPPPPTVTGTLSASPTTIYIGEKTTLEASDVTPSKTQVKLVYDTRLTHRSSCPEVRPRSNHNTVTLPSDDLSIELKGCWPGTAGVSLRTVDGDVELDSVSITVQAPSVEIEELASSLEQGQRDEFHVDVSDISSSSEVTYSIEMLAGDADLSFTDCANPETTTSSGSLSGSAEHTAEFSFTLYACNVGGATVFASLLHGNRTIGLDSQFVTVTEAPSPPPPAPAPPPPPPTPTPLGEPQNVTYTPSDMTEGAVRLSWEAASGGVTGYRIKQCTVVTSDGCDLYQTLRLTLGADDRAVTIERLATDMLHIFIIQAIRGTETNDSNPITVNLRPAPQNLEGVYETGQFGRITLTWDPVPNPDATYVIQQRTRFVEIFGRQVEIFEDMPIGMEFTIETQPFLNANNRIEAVVAGYLPGHTYKHKVRAVSAQGASEHSAGVETTLDDERPDPPTNVSWGSTLGYRATRISWDEENNTTYHVEVNPDSNIVAIGPVQDHSNPMIDRKYVDIKGLSHERQYVVTVYAENGAGREEEGEDVRFTPREPTYWIGHQEDHTVEFTEGNITLVNSVDIIGDDILPSARIWNQHISLVNGFPLGLLFCNDTDISCDDHSGNDLNDDRTEVTIRTVTLADENNNVLGCGPGYACVTHPIPTDDDPGVGTHMTNMNMIFENPGYNCTSVDRVTGDPLPACQTGDLTEFVWTYVEADHNTNVTRDDDTVRYVYIRYIMLHEFGHTMGLPDFYRGGGQTNYDPDLDREPAIMNLPWEVGGHIQQTDRDQLDAIYRTHTRH